MPLYSEGQNLSANQISSTYLILWLRYNYFRFGKNKRPPYWNSTSGFDFGYIIAIGMLFCIRLLNFIQMGPTAAEIWRHIFFSRWRMRPLNTNSGFVFVDVTAFRRSKSISKPNFVDTHCTSIYDCDIATSVFQNKRPPYRNSTLRVLRVLTWF